MWSKGDVVTPVDMSSIDFPRKIVYDATSFTLGSTVINTTGHILDEVEIAITKPCRVRMHYNVSATFNTSVFMRFSLEWLCLDPSIAVTSSTKFARMRTASTTSIVGIGGFDMTPLLPVGLWQIRLRVATESSTGTLLVSNGSYLAAWGY